MNARVGAAGPSTQRYFRLPPELDAELLAYARDAGLPVSRVVRIAVARYLHPVACIRPHTED